jgi:hypothetical protein
MKTFSVIAVAMVISLVCLAGATQAEMVTNGDFSADDAGWTVNAIKYPTAGYGYAMMYDHPGDPTNMDMELSPYSNPTRAYQQIGTVSANTVYTLKFDGRNDGVGNTSHIRGSLCYEDAGDWNEIVPDGGMGSNAVSLTDSWATYTAGVHTVASPSYVGHSLAVFLSCSTNWGDLDNISVIATTPEPSTVTLVAIGLIGLLCYAWRKRK